MFGLIGVMQALKIAEAEREAEQRFYAYAASLSEDQRSILVENYRAEKEKKRLEGIAERRHRELCEAIKEAGRRASFWP